MRDVIVAIQPGVQCSGVTKQLTEYRWNILSVASCRNQLLEVLKQSPNAVVIISEQFERSSLPQALIRAYLSASTPQSEPQYFWDFPHWPLCTLAIFSFSASQMRSQATFLSPMWKQHRTHAWLPSGCAAGQRIALNLILAKAFQPVICNLFPTASDIHARA